MLAPLCWSVAVLFYRRSTQLASPQVMAVFKNAVAAGLLALTALALGVPFPSERTLADWGRLVGSGVLGLAIADTLLFSALRRVGAARIAIVDTIYSPTLLLLSWGFLGERLGPAFFAGAAMVLAGVVVAHLERSPAAGAAVDAEARREALVGTLLALGSILGTTVGVILSKPVLEGSHLVEVTLTRMVAGLVVQLPVVWIRGEGAEVLRSFGRRDLWRTLLPASVIGTYLSLLFWMGGFKWAPASVAAVLNQLATVYILVLARVVLSEPVDGRKIAGGAMAVLGALTVVLSTL